MTKRSVPLIVCHYGWGRRLSLYQDHLDLHGKRYALTDLLQVRARYFRILGIASARLELRFRSSMVIVRGIAAVEEARRIAEYLHRYVSTSRRNVYRSRPRRMVTTADQPIRSFSRMRKAATTEERGPVQVSHWLHRYQELRERRKQRLQSERSLREYGFDVEQLRLRLQQETLPRVPVPVRLLPGEYAHYSADVTLCDEIPPDVQIQRYPARDHGKLILTSERLIYFGRKCQIVLGYGRLVEVTELQGAIAFTAEHWSKRELFAVKRPLEFLMYLETIVQRFQQVQHINQRLSPWRGTSVRQVFSFSSGEERQPRTDALSGDLLSTDEHEVAGRRVRRLSSLPDKF
uniref:Uncharacterized protein n=1 Tax=Thermosporothrix sp. COM3 TaxID=2490863 RepID=A0A455SQL9_9CHLR|nr:hypothetical protein KTC_39730 [Thermosporothrix sp. COM3]